MHRMEQLALAAGITLEGDGARVLLDGEDITEAIRGPEVSKAASLVATIPGVRISRPSNMRAAFRTTVFCCPKAHKDRTPNTAAARMNIFITSRLFPCRPRLSPFPARAAAALWGASLCASPCDTQTTP